MRIIAGDDTAHVPWRSARVFYEGIPVKGVTIADSDEGWLELITTDDKGKAIVNPAGTGIATHRMYGYVRIELLPEKP